MNIEENNLYIMGFEAMSELLPDINGEESEKEFLQKILNVAVKSIPEAECGSIWKIDGTIYKAVSGVNYEEGTLLKMEIPYNHSYISQFNDFDILETSNITKFKGSEEKLGKINSELHQKEENMITLITPLKVQNRVVGHIYLDNYKLKSFSESSKKLLNVFKNFSSTFLTLKYLRDLEKEANELNKVYLSFISHELRTPLTSILGYSETILENTDLTKSENRNYVRKIYASSKHMNSLIDDISTFNKLNRDENLKISTISYKQMLFESISIVEPILSPDVELNIKYEGEIPENIITDSTKLRQILVNIIGNSVKYTDYGYVDVTSSFDDKRKMFIIKVEDSGPGIPEEKLEDIFKPFVRLSKNKPGSGLGLAIVKKTVSTLKGKIEIQSRLNFGTTVTVRIPEKIEIK
ncbi:MAG: HAMP domain-containing histidine kinase [Thermotogae bacterium]|nr:HAMP domain-containing histidine kinase [Thermotogota bacterium]